MSYLDLEIFSQPLRSEEKGGWTDEGSQKGTRQVFVGFIVCCVILSTADRALPKADIYRFLSTPHSDSSIIPLS
jgi:hypothetical protein